MVLLEAPPASASALLDRIEDALGEHIAGAEQFDDSPCLPSGASLDRAGGYE